jgi:hypothetical protein
MKKPTLRLRQVFEGPTHFKVVKPLGNPIKIAKKGLSPSLMGRLRKFAREGEVTPPVDDQERADAETLAGAGGDALGMTTEQMIAQAHAPAGSTVTEGEGSFGVPELPAAAPVIPPAQPVGASVPDLELPEPAPVAPPIAPVMAAPAVPVVAPAAAPAPPVVVVQAAQPAPAAAPEPPKPTPKEVRQQRVDAYMAAFEEQEAKRIADQTAAMERIAQINQQANDAASSAITRARDEYDKRQRELTEFDRPKETTGTDIARSIGSALSVALGAFASGMTGMPNFALKMYEDAINRDLLKQRQQRDSILKQMEVAGLSVEDAEKMYRAQKDKEFATRLNLAAQSTTNPKAREEAQKAAFQFAQKAAVDEADIQKKVAETFKATRQGELAGAQAGVVQPEFELKVIEQKRKIEKDKMDAIDAALERGLKEKLSAEQIRAQIYGINKRFEADKAALEAKAKGEEVPAGLESASQYDQLQAAFKAEGTKGLAKRVAQTFRVDGVNLLARSEEEAKSQQKLFENFRSSKDTLDELIEKIEKMKAYDALLPTQRASQIRSIAAKFAVAFPKSENFNRALSVADKDVVLSEVLQNPTTFQSWLFDQSKASLKALRSAMEDEKVNQLKDAAVEGDPNLSKVIGKTENRGISSFKPAP